ncbi:MAG TPA: hypothetical protein VIR57_10075 [Chloroflexota bacterium]
MIPLARLRERARVRVSAAIAALAVASTLLLAACSPEAGRTRGGGPGADTGNRSADVELHPASSEAYYGTPNLNPRVVTAAKK